MNQDKIGKFISECRKQNGFTQAELAEKLGLSDKAISKWENGRGLPDATNMLELCNIFNISVNELLNGERLNNMENYKEIAEQNLLELKETEEQLNKKYLRAGTTLSTIAMLAGFVIMMENLILVEYGFISRLIGYVMVFVSSIVVGIVVSFWGPKETSIGYLECPKCKSRFALDKHTIKNVSFRPFSKQRQMKTKCPNCTFEGYHRHYNGLIN